MGGPSRNGKPGSGGHGRNRGVHHWTARRQRELDEALERQKRMRAQKRAAAKERARVRRNERDKAKRAERRAAGLPRPYHDRIQARREERKAAGLPRNYEAPGSSTPRWRKWRAKQKGLLKAWDAALRENRRRTRRIAKGLPATPKSPAQRTTEARERRKQAWEVYVVAQWWSEEIPPAEAKEILRGLHPSFTEYQVEFEHGRILSCAHHEKLNLNRFILSRPEGIQFASERRAIFYDLYYHAQGGSQLPDVSLILEQEAAIKSVADLPSIVSLNCNAGWLRNLTQRAVEYGKSLVDLAFINREVRKAKK